MKSIKLIHSNKKSDIGTIERVRDIDAEKKVKTGFWSYVCKTEWKDYCNTNTQIKEIEESSSANVDETKKSNKANSSRKVKPYPEYSSSNKAKRRGKK